MANQKPRGMWYLLGLYPHQFHNFLDSLLVLNNKICIPIIKVFLDQVDF